jgi:FG-GAP repeat
MRLPRAALLVTLAAGPAAAQTLMETWDGLATDDNFGRSVAFAGDVNGDGYDDVIVGAPLADPLGLLSAGRATIFSGADGSVLHTLNGAQAGERQGWSVAGIGDVNGDGFADVAVGVSNYNSSAAVPDIGALRVWSGKTSGLLYTTIPGQNSQDHFGVSVGGRGDLDADGWPGLLVGADLHNGVSKPDAGRAYAYDLLVHQENIGFGGPGAAFLDVFGPPLGAGKQAQLLLTGAAPSKLATLFASAVLQPTLFKGGVLAPGLGSAVMLTLVTDAQGRIELGGIKGGGGPYDVYVQIVIKDPAQAKGYALSNAVKMHFLP